MHPHTAELKRQLLAEDEMEARFARLRNAYEGETAFVFSCGPSFRPPALELLRDKLRGRLVVSVKQSYPHLAEHADFHLVNAVNSQIYKRREDAIACVVTSFSDPEPPGWEPDPTLSCQIDSRLAALSPEEKDSHWLVRRRNFDDYTFDKIIERPWGPSLMIEVVLYLLLHMGVRRAVCVGWDVTPADPRTNKMDHFYERKSLKREGIEAFEKLLRKFPRRFRKSLRSFTERMRHVAGEPFNVGPVSDGENEAIWAASGDLYEYFRKSGLRIELASSVSRLSSAIPRVNLADILNASP